MTNHEILKKAQAIVASLIAQKTPDLHETLEAAGAKFAEIVAASKGLEPGQSLPAPFAQSIGQVCDYLDSFRSGYASNDASQTVAAETAAETARNAERFGKAQGVKKGISKEKFVEHVKTTVEKAMSQKTGECLRSLHALQDAITKSISNVESFGANTTASSFEEVAQFSVGVDMDPLQIQTTDATQSLAAAQSAAPAGSNFAAADTSSAGAVAASKTVPTPTMANNQSAAPAGDSNFEAVGKSFADLAASVEKNTKDSAEDIGWTTDLNCPEFMTGRRKVDFGRDGTKPTD